MKWALLLPVLTATWSHHALAEDRAKDSGGRVELAWQAPSECPDRAWVIREAQQLTGTEGARGRDTLDVTAAITHESDAIYVLAIRTSPTSPVRRVSDSSCRDLAATAAVVIAFALDALAEEAIVRSRSEPAPRRFSLGAFGGSQLGLLPEVTWGATLLGGVAFRQGEWIMRAEGLVATWSKARTATGEIPKAGVDAQMTLIGGGRGCGGRGARVEVGVCVGAEVGVISAQAFGITDPSSATGPWIGGTVGGYVRVPLTDAIGLHVMADGIVSVSVPRFTVDVMTPEGAEIVIVASPGRVGGRVLFGGDLRF